MVVSSANAWISVGDGRLTYEPSAEKLAAFQGAAAALLKAQQEAYPYKDPITNQPCLAADLVLEGGGVKGIALAGAVLVLNNAGYRFPRVAGTSAGAIAAALIATIQKAGKPMSALGDYLAQVKFSSFMKGDKLQNWANKVGGLIAKAADGGELLRHMGLYDGDYLYEWLNPILDGLKIKNFGGLAMPPESDPGMDPALKDPNRRFSLVVHTSDITRGQLVRIPWNLNDYGQKPDDFSIADAVRASMSIPFFFEPVRQTSIKTTVEVPQNDGTIVKREFEGGQVTWVDGGMLSNFPIQVFDRTDGEPPRWPTIGIKLSSQPLITAADVPVKNTAREAFRCLQTMMNEWDRYIVQDPIADRIIFIDNGGISATQFDLSPAQQQTLFSTGAAAALDFVIEQSKGKGSLLPSPGLKPAAKASPEA